LGRRGIIILIKCGEYRSGGIKKCRNQTIGKEGAK
jgi:hypothetical protein